MSCQQGDIFCRECALANILAQKKELKRANKARQDAERQAAQRAAAKDDEERARALRDFEMTQAGMSGTSKTTATEDPARDRTETTGTELVVADKNSGSVKRKFALDEDDVDRSTKEDRSKARKALDDEKVCYYSSLHKARIIV